MSFRTQWLQFPGHSGATLDARLDRPDGRVRAYALFAHCFICSKDFSAARLISRELAKEGVAVLRFDFTGLGKSEGEFARTSLSSNIADFILASRYLRDRFEAPSLLIGHSFGGAAVLSAAKYIPEARAVVTIGAPSNSAHVLDYFGNSLAQIEAKGIADVSLGGRKVPITRQFVDDARSHDLLEDVAKLEKPLLVLHSPLDRVVGIENAAAIFQAAKHPKSFISLDEADHLITEPKYAAFAARMVSAWLTRYCGPEVVDRESTTENARIAETGEGNFQNTVQVGPHMYFVDEPEDLGGLGSGPSPYDLLSAALGGCTSMTLRLYARKKKVMLGRISVDVHHGRTHAEDCEKCLETENAAGGIDHFERVISIEGAISDTLRSKVEEIAGKCPVHRTLERVSKISTSVKSKTELVIR